MHLLVVEDEQKVATFLKRSLEAEGNSVHCCGSIEELDAFLLIAVEPPAAVILDRRLGGQDSLTRLRQVKSRFPQAAILILSAIDVSDEKALALDLGADDYLSKPFSITELSARIRALSRRGGKTPAATVISVRDVSLDLHAQALLVNGQRLDITRKEFLVLVALCEKPGRVFNKFHLLEKVWDSQADIESNTVEVTIRKVRAKLSAAGSRLEILNRRNVGYWVEP